MIDLRELSIIIGNGLFVIVGAVVAVVGTFWVVSSQLVKERNLFEIELREQRDLQTTIAFAEIIANLMNGSRWQVDALSRTMDEITQSLNDRLLTPDQRAHLVDAYNTASSGRTQAVEQLQDYNRALEGVTNELGKKTSETYVKDLLEGLGKTPPNV